MVNQVDDATSRDLDYHAHGPGSRNKTMHPMLGGIHTDSDTTASPLVEGDIFDVNAAGKQTRVARSVPGGANLLNVWSFVTATTRGAYRALFDATAPTTIAEGDAADAGTGVIAARVTHKHAAPATWLATVHDLLSARHGDTTAAAVARGAIITGQGATPKWTLLPKPSTPSVLYHDATDVAWDSMAWTAVAFNAGDFAAVTAGTWTVAAGDVVSFRYRLIGKTMLISLVLSATTIARSGGNPQVLSVTIPAGKTAAATFYARAAFALDNGVVADVLFTVTGTTILIQRTDSAQWANATDTTYIWGQVMLETT